MERLKGVTTSANAASAGKTSLQPPRDARIPLSPCQPFSPSAELPHRQCRSISIPNRQGIRKWPTTLVLSTRTYCNSCIGPKSYFNHWVRPNIAAAEVHFPKPTNSEQRAPKRFTVSRKRQTTAPPCFEAAPGGRPRRSAGPDRFAHFQESPWFGRWIQAGKGIGRRAATAVPKAAAMTAAMPAHCKRSSFSCRNRKPVSAPPAGSRQTSMP